jgi:uncharacterized repeat protein (TIGR02543 family)
MKTNKALALIIISLLFIGFYSCFKIEPAQAVINSYAVFHETGLAAGTSWTVQIVSTPYSSTTDTISIPWLPHAPAFYVINVPDGYTSTSMLSGFFDLEIGETRDFYVTFTALATYNVTFTQSGLASGTNWTINLNGNIQSSTNDTVTFSGLSSGTYGYSITTPSNYICGSATTGSVTVSGANVNKPVTFVSTTISDWPMLHHDPLHTGFSNATGPTTNNLLWSTTVSFSAVSSSPAIVDGLLYVGADDGKFYCLNATTGQVSWSQTLFTGTYVWCSPAVANGLVYIGCNDQKLHALYTNNGTQKWEFETGNSVQSSPVVVDGVVYFGSNNGKLYALDAITGSFLWDITVGDFIVSAPAVVDNVVYFGSADHYLYAYNTTSHNQIWNCDLNGQIRSSPTVTNGVVYIGSDDNNVYAVNTSSGTILWSQTTATVGGVSSTPTVVNDVVYVGSGDVYALNAANGDVLWNKAVTSGTDCSPIVVGNILYVGSWGRTAYALNITNGNEVWSKSVGADIWPAPAFANDIVYFGCDDGKIYAFGSPSSYTLTMKTVGQGTVLPGNGTQTAGTTIDIQAIPADGWSFSGWSGDASGSANTTLTMTGNLVVTATFYRTTYNVTVEQYAKDVLSNSTVYTYPANSTQILSIESIGIPPDYSFDYWDLAGVIGTNSSVSVLMDQDHLFKVYLTHNRYVINITNTEGGTTTPLNGVYNDCKYGASGDITAVPDSGYSFSHWMLDGANVSTNSIYTILIDANHTLVAFFTPANCTLTMITVGQGTVSPGNQTYLYGTDVDIAAMNVAGWSFAGWSGAASGTSNTTITLTENCTVTATFTQNSYTLAMNTIGHGSVLPGNQTCEYGELINLSAIPEAGWSFANWTGAVSGTTNTTITMNANYTVTATFTQDYYTFTLIIVGEGYMKIRNGTYLSGTVIPLAAKWDDGWSFAGYSGDVISSESRLDVTLNGNMTVIATFTQDTYSLTMITVGQGSVSPGNQTYLSGTVVNLTALNAAGWSFSGWSGGDASGTTNTTVTMDGNLTVTATFTQDMYTLTVLTTGDGIVSPSNSSYLSGTIVNLTAINAVGWTFMGWGGSASGVTNTTITMNSNQTVTALFTQDHYTLTMLTTGNGNVSPGNQTYLSGTEVDIAAMNAKGWTFTGWSGDETGSTNTTITMTGNLTITATFTQDIYTLTMTTTGQGTVTPGNQTYLSGTNVDLAAINAKGWSFDGWSGDASGSTNTTITMDGDMTIIATFTQDVYTLTMIIDGEGTVLPGNQTYLSGTNVDLKAFNATHWEFAGWSGDASGLTNTTITMDGDMTVTATFTKIVYPVAFYLSGVGNDFAGALLTVDGTDYTAADMPLSFNWESGSQHTFKFASALSVNSGKQYVWESSTGLSALRNDTLTVMASGNINGTFVTQYWFAVSSEHGTVGGSGWYFDGTSAHATLNTLTVAVDNNTRYSFAGWSGAASGSGSPSGDILMNAPKTATATWELQYLVTFVANPTSGGSTTPNDSFWTAPGEIQLSASPNGNYTFKSWTTTGNVTIASVSSQETTANVSGNCTITANFEVIQPKIIATVTTNGDVYDIDISGTITVQQMSNLTITPYADISTTKVEFNVTGPAGTTGFGNMTIPKSAIPYGTTPLVYIDGVLAEDQGYSEDANNYYVWYTTHFSMHKISIDFTSNPIDYTIYYILSAVIILIIAITAVLLIKRKKQPIH